MGDFFFIVWGECGKGPVGRKRGGGRSENDTRVLKV